MDVREVGKISRTLTKEGVENTPGGTLKSIKIDSLIGEKVKEKEAKKKKTKLKLRVVKKSR